MQNSTHQLREFKTRRFNVYVIGLDKLVLNERKFAERNPRYDPTKPCVYVGLTGLDPKQRFVNHKQGLKACKFVRKYGLYLKPRLYERFNPMTYDEACVMERELARRLRNRGYAVWQN